MSENTTENNVSGEKTLHQLIGQRIRNARVEQGLSMLQLSNKLGISHQQLQKYEKGNNMLKPATLLRLSSALGIPTWHFIQESDIHILNGEPVDVTDANNDYRKRKHSKRLDLHLVTAFNNISNYKHKLLVLRVARGLSDSNNNNNVDDIDIED